MFRPNSRSQLALQINCINIEGIHKNCLIGIKFSVLQCSYHVLLQVWLLQTVVKVVKIGNLDVVSVVVHWVIQCVMSALCAV
jgi:hypothetical protein